MLDACADLDIPVTMYGLDVFYEPLVTDVQADELRERSTTPVRAELAAGLISFHHRAVRHAGATIGDAGAVCVLIEPGRATERLPVRVELAGTWSRGPHHRRPARLVRRPGARPARPGRHVGRRRPRRRWRRGSPTCGSTRCGGRR